MNKQYKCACNLPKYQEKKVIDKIIDYSAAIIFGTGIIGILCLLGKYLYKLVNTTP